MASTLRNATALIHQGKCAEAHELIRGWLQLKPHAVYEPDFKTFVASPAGAQLWKWKLQEDQRGKA